MRIRHLSLKNFRGIEELEWTIDALTVCLIGPNDSTKSTILEAIQLALHPWWNPPLADSDFYQLNVDETIVIKATVGDLPESLQTLQKFGGYLGGWNKETGLRDEPGEDDEVVLTIKLTVDQSLEPKWNVCCCRGETSIGHVDRQKLGLSRVGSYVDRDMTWRKGSALYRVTETIKGTEFAALSRKARAALSAESLDELAIAARKVEDMAQGYGVKPVDKFHPEFDPENIDINAGSLSLHDAKVPFRLQGLGTKRLTSLAMQKSVTDEGTILLIDEIEHGLEPFRVRQLVRNLRDATDDNDGQRIGQVFFTTHSPIAVVECETGEWHIVRNELGFTIVTEIRKGIEGTIRSSAEALLSRKVIVCEGKTEVGILRAFDRMWKAKHNGAEMAYIGVSTIDGDGRTNAPNRAVELRSLGYDALLFVDSDKPIEPSKLEVESQNVSVVQWPDEMNTEQRIFSDLEDQTILDIVRLAIDITDNESDIMQALGSNLGRSGFNMSVLESLLADPAHTVDVRKAIAKAAAKTFGWFKRIDYGEQLGEIVANAVETVPDKPLYTCIKEIEDWIYEQ